MTSMINEQLSALLDGELPIEQEALLMRRLENEPELRDSLSRYSLIGELLRDDGAVLGAQSVSDRVAAALSNEAVAEQTPLPAQRWNGGLVGAGIAASIALLVMFNLDGLGGRADPSAGGATQIVQTAQAGHAHAGSERMTRYLVAHSRFANNASRQLQDAHFAMTAHHLPGNWSADE